MRWMCSKTAPDSSVVVYRGQFTTKAYEEREIEYSADGRCQLYLDGVRVSEGPERGAPQRWYCAHAPCYPCASHGRLRHCWESTERTAHGRDRDQRYRIFG